MRISGLLVCIDFVLIFGLSCADTKQAADTDNDYEEPSDNSENVTSDDTKIVDEADFPEKHVTSDDTEEPEAEWASWVSDEIINEINNEQKYWKAGKNFRHDLSRKQLMFLIGLQYQSRSLGFFTSIFSPGWWGQRYEELSDQFKSIKVPAKFDARENWPNCASIRKVADTGLCATSWAVATTHAIEDRYCISTEINRTFAAKELVDCCDDTCTQHENCEAGDPLEAYAFMQKKGLPTGGAYNSSTGCKPYTIPTTISRFGVGKDITIKQPDKRSCIKECTNTLHSISNVEEDSIKIRDFYWRAPQLFQLFSSSKPIKGEIYLRGSVTTQFTVYSDLFTYKEGVYFPTTRATQLGKLTVRLIGWGEENGLEYWLASGVWGVAWGDRGFVKLKAWDEKLEVETGISVARF